MENKSCENCDGKCCKYVAIEIDVPENLEDFEDIKWYVAHKKIGVFVDEDYKWYIEFSTPCEFLGENNKCNNYENRPKICRDYHQDVCLFHNEDYKEKFNFKKIEDIEKYIKEVFNAGEHVIPDEDTQEEEEE